MVVVTAVLWSIPGGQPFAVLAMHQTYIYAASAAFATATLDTGEGRQLIDRFGNEVLDDVLGINNPQLAKTLSSLILHMALTAAFKLTFDAIHLASVPLKSQSEKLVEQSLSSENALARDAQDRLNSIRSSLNANKGDTMQLALSSRDILGPKFTRNMRWIGENVVQPVKKRLIERFGWALRRATEGGLGDLPGSGVGGGGGGDSTMDFLRQFYLYKP